MAKLTKTQQRIINDLSVGKMSEVIKNPFTGEEVLLEPTAVALYDYIKGCEILGNYKEFDQARYAFCALWPDAYMKLLD